MVSCRFYIPSGRKKVYCIVSLNSQKSKAFSTGINLKSAKWYQKSQSSKDYRINQSISNIRNSFLDIYNTMQSQKELITLERLLELYHQKTHPIAILELCQLNLEKKVLDNLAKGTLSNCQNYYNQLKTFINQLCNEKDIAAIHFNSRLANDFYYHLRKTISHNSAVLRISFVKQSINYGISPLDKLKVNPLQQFQLSSKHNFVPKHLSRTDLELLETVEFKTKTQEKIVACFIFQCYTGMAFSEMQKFDTKLHLQVIDGRTWILIQRDKVKSSYCKIPLLEKAKHILEKWNYKLPVYSNSYHNMILHEIQKEYELTSVSKLTTHVGRKTCGMILLDAGIPMQYIADILGHADVATTTKYYVRATTKHIGKELDKANLF